MLKIIKIKKSTYFYEKNKLFFDKYSDVRSLIKKIFNENYCCYGYRRIKAYLKTLFNINISEKIIRKVMKEENLIVYKKIKKKYSSYKGEISPEVPNIVKREFIVNEAYTQALTDITEFALSDGKVYLSPIIDCCSRAPVTRTIGKSPSAQLTNEMLIKTHEKIGEKIC